MVVTFRTRVPVSETMCFEDAYERSLQLDEDAKAAILSDGVAVWMFVDGVLAGECYGLSPAYVAEDIPDVTGGDPRSIYCYSTTLLAPLRGRGLSKILVAYWDGLARGKQFSRVLGHATSPAMVAVRTFFGARFGAVHQNWFGSGRTAHFYECDL